MSVFRDGSFCYLNDRQHLYLEDRSQAVGPIMAYGGTVIAYALNESLFLVALLCPADAASGRPQGSVNDTVKSIIRLYTLKPQGLSDLVDELEVAEASSIVWVGDRFIATSLPTGITSIVDFSKKKLSLFVQDEGLFPVVGLHWLGLVSAGREGAKAQVVEFWDMTKNKKVETHALKCQRANKGRKIPAVSGTCGSGNFIFAMNEDCTVHVFYVTKGSIRPLSPMINALVSSSPVPESSAVMPTPLCVAISSAQVLIGTRGGQEVVRLKYLKKEATMTVMERLPLPEDAGLLCIAVDRVLLKCTNPTTGKHTFRMEALKLAPPERGRKAAENGGGEEATRTHTTAAASVTSTKKTSPSTLLSRGVEAASTHAKGRLKMPQPTSTRWPWQVVVSCAAVAVVVTAVVKLIVRR